MQEEWFPAVTEPLLKWYRQNARDLPWRHTRDPYRIWISEIMLQQTRVAAVLGYYARFLDAFPTVEALAAASEERLLSLWQGLGYYSRARNLKRAAEQIVEQGGFPRTAQALRRFPGIGEYTAGAVASAAFGERVPAVDGNVLRVAVRLTDCHGDIGTPAVRRNVHQMVAEAFPEEQEDIRIFNQALMELGAVVCVPSGPPRCDACPVSGSCLGRIRNTASMLPVRSPKKERRAEDRTVLALFCGGRTALRRRPEAGLLAGLWEFPCFPGTWSEAEAAETVSRWGLDILEWDSRLTARHIFTHVEWHMTGYFLRVQRRHEGVGAVPEHPALVWVDGKTREGTVTVPEHPALVWADGKTGEGDGTAPENSALVWVDGRELAEYAVPSAFAKYRARAVELLEAAAAVPKEDEAVPEGKEKVAGETMAAPEGNGTVSGEEAAKRK